jgi:hypothetical protein
MEKFAQLQEVFSRYNDHFDPALFPVWAANLDHLLEHLDWLCRRLDEANWVAGESKWLASYPPGLLAPAAGRGHEQIRSVRQMLAPSGLLGYALAMPKACVRLVGSPVLAAVQRQKQ